MPLNPSRTVDELRELRQLTGDENGAQRVAWTDTWKRAQEWMSSKLEGTGAVRAGFVHYNTPDEVDRLLTALDELC